MKPVHPNRRLNRGLCAVFAALLLAWTPPRIIAGQAARPAAAKAAPARMYREGEVGPATLRYVEHVPVMKLYGTPEDIGEQAAKLLGDAGTKAVRRYLDTILIGPLRSLVMTQSRVMEKHTPERYLREMRAFAAHSPLTYDEVLLINTFADIKKMIRCTTIAAAAKHNPAGRPLLGRNFDFPSFGFAHRYGLVIVVHPKGKRAFASVGHPGIVGTHSFMNADGLAGAVMEVFTGKPKFNAKAMPALMLYRRVAEDCGTVDAALDVLREAPRCSSNNLILQTGDSTAALAEFTVREFAVRRPDDGLLFGTNHHRSKELGHDYGCRRMKYLLKARDAADASGAWSLEAVIGHLRRTALGQRNFYSMVFSPAERALHVAMGTLPAANGRYVTLDRTALFAPTLRRRNL